MFQSLTVSATPSGSPCLTLTDKQYKETLGPWSLQEVQFSFQTKCADISLGKKNAASLKQEVGFHFLSAKFSWHMAWTIQRKVGFGWDGDAALLEITIFVSNNVLKKWWLYAVGQQLWSQSRRVLLLAKSYFIYLFYWIFVLRHLVYSHSGQQHYSERAMN